MINEFDILWRNPTDNHKKFWWLTNLDFLARCEWYEAWLLFKITFLLLDAIADESNKVSAEVSTKQCFIGGN